MEKTKAQIDAENLTHTLHKTVREYRKLAGGIPSVPTANINLKVLSKQLVSRHRGGMGT